MINQHTQFTLVKHSYHHAIDSLFISIFNSHSMNTVVYYFDTYSMRTIAYTEYFLMSKYFVH